MSLDLYYILNRLYVEFAGSSVKRLRGRDIFSGKATLSNCFVSLLKWVYFKRK